MGKLEQIGHFRLLAPLGEGAGSEVWLARDERDGSEVALKLLRHPDGVALAYLRNEADVLARLDHPNVVRLMDAGEEGEVAWLTTEAIRKPAARESSSRRRPGSMPSLLIDGMGPGLRRDDGFSASTFRQLLLALDHVHSRGYVHADIKPANLLLDAHGNLKLVDFGLARRLGAPAGPAHGSPNYMAPEQLRGQALSPSTDIYSVGLVLYQSLVGVLPFTGSAFEVMQHKLQGTPDLAVEPAFKALLQRSLAPLPGQRFDTALAFLSAFDAACQSS